MDSTLVQSLLLTILSLMALFASLSSAGDPDMLQDVCVADLKSAVTVNGFPCKPLADVMASDFFTDILVNPGNTNNSVGSSVTGATVSQFPGLNTLGVSMARIDYAPRGLNPAHSHPRGTEIVFVLEGVLDVGFITTGDRLFQQTIKKGEVFVFPRGLVHFQINRCDFPASVIAAFNSQLQGTQSTARTLFGADPEVPNDVLAKGFMIDQMLVQKIKKMF